MAIASDVGLLNSSQLAGVTQAQQAWQTAKANGDTVGMANAHALAESIRNSAGYSSNADGTFSGFIDTPSVPQVLQQEIPDLSSYIDQIKAISAENNAVSQAMAEKQWAFNSEEAKKNRDWQEYMSNTAHQREVADLLKAGLNPILSAGGNGASVGSGATASGSSASPDTSANSVIGSYLSSLISSATAINTANINAKNNMAIAQLNAQYGLQSTAMYNDTSKIVAMLQNEASHYTADESTRRMLQELAKALENSEYMAKNYPSTQSQLLVDMMNSTANAGIGLGQILLNLINGGNLVKGKN